MDVCNKRLKIHFKGIRGKIQNVKLETEKEKSNWEQSVTDCAISKQLCRCGLTKCDVSLLFTNWAE